jgi:predicted nucleic acid-binding Zn ribbon protein
MEVLLKTGDIAEKSGEVFISKECWKFYNKQRQRVSKEIGQW